MSSIPFDTWLVAVGVLLSAAQAAAGEAVFPGRTWATKTPAEVGMDPKKLDTLRDYVRGRGCIVRHGYLVPSGSICFSDTE